jgi:plasmanylethanolamine desaturase
MRAYSNADSQVLPQDEQSTSYAVRLQDAAGEVVPSIVPESHSDLGSVSLAEHSGPLHLVAEWASALMFPIVLIVSLFVAASHLYKLELLWLALLAIPIGLALGDFVSGLVHWAADTYGREDTTIIGPSFIRAFRQHHVYPLEICSHNLVSVVGNTCILAVPVLSLMLYLIVRGPVSFWRAFPFLTFAIVTGVTVATNQFHKWAHQQEIPLIVRVLQRSRLILAPDHHQTHHSRPFNAYYCITNGWMNPLLDRLQFFRRVEATLRVIGINPSVR